MDSSIYHYCLKVIYWNIQLQTLCTPRTHISEQYLIIFTETGYKMVPLIKRKLADLVFYFFCLD